MDYDNIGQSDAYGKHDLRNIGLGKALRGHGFFHPMRLRPLREVSLYKGKHRVSEGWNQPVFYIPIPA